MGPGRVQGVGAGASWEFEVGCPSMPIFGLQGRVGALPGLLGSRPCIGVVSRLIVRYPCSSGLSSFSSMCSHDLGFSIVMYTFSPTGHLLPSSHSQLLLNNGLRLHEEMSVGQLLLCHLFSVCNN